MAAVADVIARALLDAGVRTLFGVPGGGSNLDLIAAAARAGLPFVLSSTETAAAIAALAQAEITGAPGACLTTLGPGATSVVNGVACAFLERAPLVVFTDSQPPSASFAHQRIDHGALLRSVTKSSETLTAENALDALTRALYTASDGRPGPVHLDCPGDVASASAPEVGVGMNSRVAVTHTALSRLEAACAKARRPLLLAGLGVRSGLASFCERHRIPAMVTYKAKGVVPDDHPWFAGVFTNATIEQPRIDESDLLIGVGLDPVELIPRPWKHQPPIVYVGPWPVEDVHVPFELQVVDAHDDSLALLDRLLGETEWDESAVARDAQRQRDQIARRDDEGFTAQRVVEAAARKVASTVAHVTVDAGAHMFPATVLWPACRPGQMLISNGLSTMGFALPAAVGAALLDKSRPVVALTGDGGLLMCSGELLTAARERLPVVTIVFSDDALSLIEIKQQARTLAPGGVALGRIDWLSIARGFGVQAWSAPHESALERALDAALDHGGPALIEARIDRRNYGATLRAVRG
jgi:acetolactate synthase-1/2/3 large subunit